jgi:hypothetical protein
MGDPVRSTQGQISLTDTPLEPSIFRTRPIIMREKFRDGKARAQRGSNCLPTQLFWVETLFPHG